MPPPPVVRRTAWSEGRQRLRDAAVTEPGRLRAAGALLAALIVLFGAVSAWQVSERAAAADAVVEHSQPLSADAARIYRSLADADTAASSGFLAEGREPAAVRKRYEKDIDEAAGLLAGAAAKSRGSASAQREITTLNRGLPLYTGAVEAARSNNRQELPLGGAYLRYANDRMREDLLPAAKMLYRAETARLGADYEDAEAWPWLAIGSGMLALGALAAAQRREYLRTNRVWNIGLLGATAASAVLLLWLTAGHGIARASLAESDTKAARSLHELNDAWTGALQARGDENMTLVTRGTDTAYEESYEKHVRRIAGDPEAGGGLLTGALRLADDDGGRAPVKAAERAFALWQERHKQAREKDVSGDYEGALRKVIGAQDSTRESFDAVDRALGEASRHEQAEFTAAAGAGRGAFTGLVPAAVVLAVAGAGAAVLGIGRRLAEYR